MFCVDVHVQVRTLVSEYGDMGEKKLRPEHVWKDDHTMGGTMCICSLRKISRRIGRVGVGNVRHRYDVAHRPRSR